jgi:hypothetical protein
MVKILLHTAHLMGQEIQRGDLTVQQLYPFGAAGGEPQQQCDERAEHVPQVPWPRGRLGDWSPRARVRPAAHFFRAQRITTDLSPTDSSVVVGGAEVIDLYHVIYLAQDFSSGLPPGHAPGVSPGLLGHVQQADALCQRIKPVLVWPL